VAIETPDDRTLKVTLENPTPFFLGLTALTPYLPQNQEFVERQGERYAQSAEALLYNGPYTLTELHPTEGATFVKNEDYWDKENVDIERVEARSSRTLPPPSTSTRRASSTSRRSRASTWTSTRVHRRSSPWSCSLRAIWT